MANATLARVFILVLIILSTFFVTLQARNLHHHHHPFIRQGNIAESHHKYLGLDLSKKHMRVQDDNGADDVPHKDGNTHRLTPEGPDPHHNFAAPPN
ncbi:unnamed protein product [Sphenostylis stenocarpa]|uniref:Uncharacterized protein n=1 Tax=Sphenostylis stenocarpa TaxID=92480 RepID=A0AA86VI68_9FABA|nr:unnamed protein product [Sphenostylis stenocarpa]